MSMNINSALQKFNDALMYRGSENDRMTLKGKTVGKGAADAGILGRAKPVSDDGDDTQARQNNAIRTELMSALVSQYGSKARIPASVLQALKGSSLVGGSDMKMDENGNVISGRPLTARRIRAVIRAVIDDLAKSAPKDNTPYWQGDLSAKGAEPSKEKIRGRLEAMAKVAPYKRFERASLSQNTVSNFINLIKQAQRRGLYGDAMVEYITGAVRERNSTAHGFPDIGWFQGVKDETSDRLKRDISRLLNVDGAHDEYWADPKAATKRDLDEFNLQEVDEKARDYDVADALGAPSLYSKANESKANEDAGPAPLW